MTSPATSPAAPPPPRLPRQLYVLLACSFCVALGYGILAPVLPVLAHSYGVSLSATGLVVSAFALARLLFAPSASKLVSARGEVIIYMSGLLVVAASTLGAAFAPTFPLLVLLRGLGGIGSTMFTIAATGLLIRITPSEIRGRASAAFGGSFLAGNIVGPALGGVVAGLGLRAPFFIYSGMLVLASAIMGASLVRARLRSTSPATTTTEPPGMTFREALTRVKYQAVVGSSLANGWAVFGTRVAMLPLLAVYVASRPSFGWDPLDGLTGTQLTGVAMSAFALGTLCMLPFSGRLADSWGRARPAILGMLGIAATFAVIGWSPNGTLLVVASLLGGISEATYSPAMQAGLADVLGGRRGGSALAAPQMAADVGAILGPVAAGAVADAAGFGMAFTMVAILPLVGAFMWMRVLRATRLTGAGAL